ncbi:hypothetical protein M1L60_29375 [Actinoplanes sp. TRM 88003]|uniref:Uncharacterized protein n=1 Tax=Paractinoplanes aksuensis TaxID=2939490 RepID=A0ABT1DV30_9ACTN|nr:hypothetical protein [Actinoplanes aksuensis]MCO8274715.1 hypothetical protein [Actinoplanes aksuensis]
MVEWARLRHAYGSAEDVPGLLASLRAADEAERHEAFGELYNSITHQGNRYSASAAAVPSLLELIADPSTPDREFLLVLLGRIAVGLDEAWLPGGVRTDLLDEDGLRAYEAVGAGLPVLLPLLAEPELADSAAYVIGWYRGEHAALAVHGSPTSIVACGLAGSTPRTADDSPLMRWAGAIAAARLLGTAAGDDVRAELLDWAASGRERDHTVPYLEGDLAGYALLSLPLVGVDAFEPALARLRQVSAEPALTALGVALRQAFPDGPVDGRLTPRQQRLVQVVAENPSAGLYDGVEFANFSLLLAEYGLPR